MKRFVLTEYNKSVKQLLVFDVVIKDTYTNKDIFLESKGIAPTSYRRARTKEQNIGDNIVKVLAKHFNYRLVNDNYVHGLEGLFTEIYLDINYRITENHVTYLDRINELEKDNTILFPLLKLLKLFVVAFSNKNVPDIVKNHLEDFIELTKYESYFGDELIEIYDMLKLTFSPKLTKELLAKTYSNGISYSIISGKHYLDKQFFESLFFAQKAKEIFIRQNNYKRCISINFTILNNLASTGTFDDYYKLAREQMLTIRAFGTNVEEQQVVFKHLIISAISVNEYNEVFKILKAIKALTLTDIFCYVIAKFRTLDSKSFNNWFEMYLEKSRMNESNKQSCLILIDYLKLPEKRKIPSLEECRVMRSLIEVLKWL